MSAGLAPVWRGYRTRRRCLLLALMLGPLVAAANASVSALGGELSGHVLLAAYATGLVTSAAWFAAFHCPYCARPFHWTWIVANPLSRVCLHCGFAKWRDPHSARELRRR